MLSYGGVDEGVLEGACTHGGQPVGWNIFIWLNFSVMFLFPFLVSLILTCNKAIVERQLFSSFICFT